ncbi:MAG TPA: GNAT family N-acetyltransferase [Polyangia bacterium]|nr:GNAT family N-acetyltransferase [Polyangia bacterium]
MIVRRLELGDEEVLDLIARDEADFDVEGRGKPRAPLAEAEARAFLSDRDVLVWIAEEADAVIGFLTCQIIRKRAETPELLLYEIGVRAARRRHGVGRALVGAMNEWMRACEVTEVWVLADNDVAIAFYRACGFAAPGGVSTYMTRGE